LNKQFGVKTPPKGMGKQAAPPSAKAIPLPNVAAAPKVEPAPEKPRDRPNPDRELSPADQKAASSRLAWIAFADILVFFGVLLVGFAYLWKRGDLDWVRSTEAQHASELPDPSADAYRLDGQANA
jgi:hypothetical protein